MSVRVCGALPGWICPRFARVVVDMAEEDDFGRDRMIWVCDEHAREIKALRQNVIILIPE